MYMKKIKNKKQKIIIAVTILLIGLIPILTILLIGLIPILTILTILTIYNLNNPTTLNKIIANKIYKEPVNKNFIKRLVFSSFFCYNHTNWGD